MSKKKKVGRPKKVKKARKARSLSKDLVTIFKESGKKLLKSISF